MNNKELDISKRFKEIIKVFIKYGFIDWIMPNRKFKISFLKKQALNQRWINMRLAFQELGTTFIKLGQLLSTTGHNLPIELLNELAKLQDEVSTFPFKKAKEIIEKELNISIDDTFKHFNYTCVAAASIGQVYEATFKDHIHNGKKIAIKVQRPDIKEMIKTDLNILFKIASMISKHPDIKIFDPVSVVQEFSDQINNELDFNKEYENLKIFKDFFKSDKDVIIPEVFKYHSSKVLTMGYIDGIKLFVFQKKKNIKNKKKIIAFKIANSMLRQIFFLKQIHADPHPGNIFIENNKICFIDFGTTKIITEKDKRLLLKMMVAFINYDVKLLKESLIELTNAPTEKEDSLEKGLEFFMNKYSNKTLKDINIKEYFDETFKLIIDTGISVPANFSQIIKVIIMIESICSNLAPEISLMEIVEPFLKENFVKLSLNNFKSNAASIGLSFLDVIELSPRQIKEVFKIVKKGRLNLNIEIKNSNEIIDQIGHLGNSFIFGIMLGSTMLSSAWIMNAKIPPFINGISLIGIIGFGIAGTMTLIFLIFLLINIIKHSKKK